MWPVHPRSARYPLTPAGLLLFAGISLLAGCDDTPWNRPYPAADAQENILYSSFKERPNHLDPAQSYSSNEVTFTAQIYEPPLQYHYLKRPYELVPLTATTVPEPQYLDASGNTLPADAPADEIAFSLYDIHIQPGILYQPHPAFATDTSGNALYLDLTARDLAEIHTLADFRETGTRELVAADYVYQIKRLAHPRLHSPILGLMGDYIAGLKDYTQTLSEAWDGIAGGERSWRVPGPDAVPAGRRRGHRPLHLPHQDPRQVPAAAVLAGDAVFRAGTAGGRPFLFPGRDEAAQHHAGLVSRGYRSLHADV